MEYRSSITSANAPAKPRIHHFGGRRIRTIALILSVTEAKSCPGPRIGAGTPCSASLSAGLSAMFHSTLDCPWFLDLRVRIAQPRLIGSPGPRVQLFEQAVIQIFLRQHGNAALWIIDVPENNRFRRARLLARRDDFTVAYTAIFFFGFDFHRIDSLHAVRTFFHDATAAHADVGIAHAEQAGRLPVRVKSEIEAPHLIRTVVRAIARAHAAVVDHFVQAFRAMNRRGHRANNFARRVFTMHAEHGLVVSARAVQIPFEVAVDANPVHLTANHDFRLADHRDVVFRLAGHHARAAAGTGVQVYRHAPRVAVVFHLGVQRERIFLYVGLRELRILAVLVQRRDAHDVAPFHRVVRLRCGQRPFRARLSDLESRAYPRRGERPNPTRVEARARSNAPRARASIAKKNSYAFVRVAGHHPRRRDNGSPLILQFNGIFTPESQALGRLRAQHGDAVPRELRQRLG